MARPQYKRDWDNANYERMRKDTCACGSPKCKRHRQCDGCRLATMDVYRSLAEGMWAAGWSCREIGAALGRATFQPGSHRSQRGWDLPHRYPAVNGKRVPGARVA